MIERFCLIFSVHVCTRPCELPDLFACLLWADEYGIESDSDFDHLYILMLFKLQWDDSKILKCKE